MRINAFSQRLTFFSNHHNVVSLSVRGLLSVKLKLHKIAILGWILNLSKKSVAWKKSRPHKVVTLCLGVLAWHNCLRSRCFHCKSWRMLIFKAYYHTYAMNGPSNRMYYDYRPADPFIFCTPVQPQLSADWLWQLKGALLILSHVSAFILTRTSHYYSPPSSSLPR